MVRFTIFLLFFPFVAFPTELVVNGDFEQPLGAEWVTKGNPSISDFDTSDPDMEVKLHYFGEAYSVYCCLKQRIDITGYAPEFLTFSCKAKLFADNEDAYIYSAAAVVVSYQDKYGNRVADTKTAYIDTLTKYSQKNCWPCDTLQNVSFIQDSSWQTYSFNIGTELAGIGLTNQDTIQFIEIALIDTGRSIPDISRNGCGNR